MHGTFAATFPFNRNETAFVPYGLRNTLARLTPTVSRARPLARRAFNTLRPPVERILRRKPCTRKRCRRFG